MDPNIEIRKVPTASIYKIIFILEETNSWKKLMEVIPKDLYSNEFVPKYNSEHMKLIENASVIQKRPCAEILFDEWGTSGRKRPTLQHLQQLLIRSELFRAADTVATDLLQEPLPERPKTGPAATVETSLTQIIAEKEINKMRLDSILEKMSYPSNMTVDGNNDRIGNRNLDYNQPPTNNVNKVLPFQITLSNSNTENDILTNIIQSDNRQQQGHLHVNNGDSLNNMQTPAFSKLLMDDRRTGEENATHSSPGFTMPETWNSTNNNIESQDGISSINASAHVTRYQTSVPNLSILQHTVGDVTSDTDIPMLSGFADQNRNVSPSNHTDAYNSTELPRLSAFHKTENSVSSINDLPLMSILQNERPNSSRVNSTSSSSVSDIESTSSRGTDTGQQIVVNTALSSYNYDEVLASTNNFSNQYDIENKIGGKIGEGGFGEVYIGFMSLGPVAVKRLFINKESDIVLKQFKTEVETLTQYVHKNVVSILGYSVNQPTAYCIIYEHIDNGTLRDKLDTKCLNWQKRLQIAYNTSQGLEYLHYGTGKMLIHRDVKSANILLSRDLTPKLCDFGLAKLMLRQDAMTTTVIGTSAYMAPEAFRGDVSEKMDVFSFGIVLLEMLTGLPPIDDSREGVDILTHVQDVCLTDEITPLLDPVLSDSKNAANELFVLTNKCLGEKRIRPNIKVVRFELEKLYFQLYG